MVGPRGMRPARRSGSAPNDAQTISRAASSPTPATPRGSGASDAASGCGRTSGRARRSRFGGSPGASRRNCASCGGSTYARRRRRERCEPTIGIMRSTRWSSPARTAANCESCLHYFETRGPPAVAATARAPETARLLSAVADNPQRRRGSAERRRAIPVSHRVCKKVSGALHKETVYGCTEREDRARGLTYRYFVKREAVKRVNQR